MKNCKSCSVKEPTIVGWKCPVRMMMVFPEVEIMGRYCDDWKAIDIPKDIVETYRKNGGKRKRFYKKS